MDISIKYTELDELVVEQVDNYDSGEPSLYEITEVHQTVYKTDGRRAKHLMIVLTERQEGDAESACEQCGDDHSSGAGRRDGYRDGYTDGFQDGRVRGKNQQASVDHSGGLVDPYERVFGVSTERPQDRPVEWGNR